MKPPFLRHGAAGTLIAAALVTAACSTPHAVPVRCSGPLRPINSRPAALATASRGTAPAPAQGRGS